MQVRAGINLVFGKGKINDVTRRERKKLDESKEQEPDIPNTLPEKEGDTLKEESIPSNNELPQESLQDENNEVILETTPEIQESKTEDTPEETKTPE